MFSASETGSLALCIQNYRLEALELMANLSDVAAAGLLSLLIIHITLEGNIMLEARNSHKVSKAV